METVKDIILILTSSCLAIANFYLLFKFRKKDFQIAILKEQIIAYNKLLENLFQTNERIRQAYNEGIDVEKLLSDPGSIEQLQMEQSLIFLKFGTYYSASFSKFQSLMFLLPEDVIVVTHNYYSYFANLFENENDNDLGIKLYSSLNQKVFDVMNIIREHLATDAITSETRKLFSSAKQFALNEDDD